MAPLLEGPGVAVGIGEIGEAGVIATLRVQPRAKSPGPRFKGLLMPNRPDSDAPGNESGSLGRQICRNEVQIMDAAVRVSRHQLDGASRPRWSQLHDSEAGVWAVIDVQRESHLLGVKRARTVDVGDGQRDYFQGEHHKPLAQPAVH